MDQDQAVELAVEAIDGFTAGYDEYWLAGMRHKLGLSTVEAGDLELSHALLNVMAANRADFTLTFRLLCDVALSAAADDRLRGLFGISQWLA